MTLRSGQVWRVCWVVLMLGTASSAWAQGLDEHCVVSVLNRTAQVRSDGTWTLPNIPAGFGPVRARATCVEDGITRSGQSELFTITPGRMNAIPPIVLGSTTAIPQTLTITGNAVLTAVGATSQLTVTATYAGGATQDITAPASGTTYSTTNALIAGIGTGGLVTAVRSGTVIIRASNEGTAGLLQFRVQLAGDSDGDGIPDDIELAEGLNPNNPVDALEDADRDGLSNVAEFDRGTQIRDPDTDDDSISDGEEAVAGADGFITNPLLADSDGDGVRDALEIATGSNPLDPSSVDLAEALSRIEVAPATFVITVNAIIGEAFQQLTVTGFLDDGSTIDLTSIQRGTNYLSNNLDVCNFGAEDGRIFAGINGTCTITATNSGFTAQSQGTINTFTPLSLSFVAIPGFANNVDVSGNYAYVAAGSTGLQVVNVANRAAPVIVASIDTPGNANDVRIVGTLAYVADGASGLRIISVANPLAPVNVGSFDTAGDAWDVVVSGNRAYVADGDTGLRIIDVSNPASPQLLGSVNPDGIQKGVDVDAARNLAVVASGSSGLHIITVANPATPAIVGTLPGGDVRDVALKDDYAFLADQTRSLTSVELTNPAAPVLRSSTPLNLGGRLNDVVAAGNFTLGADVLFVNGVPIADITNLAAPVSRAILNFSNFRDDDGQGVAADGSFVYLAAVLGSAFQENGASGNSRLYIGQYLSQDDLGGIAPDVQITSPASGSTFVEGVQIPVTVNAADDVTVVSVSFLVNGQVVFTDTSFPYQFTLTAPQGASGLTLGATAVDLGGNVGTAAPVAISIVPDPLTTVTGRVLDEIGAPVFGATVTVLNNFSSTTGSDGSFVIPNVPTVLGTIVARATATVNGMSVTGTSPGFDPVAGGTTDVGTFVVKSRRKVAVFGIPSGFPQAWNADVQTKIDNTGLFTQVDAFLGGTPTLAQLQEYDAVLVYSDASFANPTAMGNVLADYVDSGGGVVLATFAFWNANGLGIEGRIKTGGYLPFTTGSQGSPGNLTLVPVDAQHPILDGVASFNGGTSSYHNTPLTVTAGSTSVANWSNGQPLIATKTTTVGRVVGLNFYPPSSDVRGDFWRSNTDGGRIMGNALIYAAK